MSEIDFSLILDKWLSGQIELAPVTELLGIKPVEVSENFAVLEMQAGKEHHNALGTLHGGILCALADAAIGAAIVLSLKKNETFTTMELSTNFLKPVVKAKLKATAHLIHRGRRSAYLECEIHNEEKELVAKIKSTCMILQAKME